MFAELIGIPFNLHIFWLLTKVSFKKHCPFVFCYWPSLPFFSTEVFVFFCCCYWLLKAPYKLEYRLFCSKLSSEPRLAYFSFWLENIKLFCYLEEVKRKAHLLKVICCFSLEQRLADYSPKQNLAHHLFLYRFTKTQPCSHLHIVHGCFHT